MLIIHYNNYGTLNSLRKVIIVTHTHTHTHTERETDRQTDRQQREKERDTETESARACVCVDVCDAENMCIKTFKYSFSLLKQIILKDMYVRLQCRTD